MKTKGEMVRIFTRLPIGLARKLRRLAKKRGMKVGELIRLILNDFLASQGPGRCRECGCTENNACCSEAGNCAWAEPDLCSFCAAIAAGTMQREDVEQPRDRSVFD